MLSNKSFGRKSLDNNANLNNETPMCCGYDLPLTDDIVLSKKLLAARSSVDTFSLKDWLNTNNYNTADCCGDAKEITVDQAFKLIDSGKVEKGKKYKIIDTNYANWVSITGISTTEFSQSGFGEFWNPDYSNTTSDGNPGDIYSDVWVSDSKGGAYNINDQVIWNNLRWKNLTGSNTNNSPDSDATNWGLLEQSKANGYILVVDPIRYNVLLEYYLGLGVTRRLEPHNSNESYLDLLWCLLNGMQNSVAQFKWGTGFFGDYNNHAHVGVLDNKNARRQQIGIYIQGGGEFHITNLSFNAFTEVWGSVLTVSNDGGLAEGYFKGQSTVVSYDSTVDSGYVYGANGAMINVIDSADIGRCKFYSSMTVNASGNGRVGDITFMSLTGSGIIITVGNNTNIYGGLIETDVSMDLTGKVTASVQVTKDYSNLYADVPIVGGAIDLDNDAFRNCGEIRLLSEGGAGVPDSLDTINNSGNNMSRHFTLIPYDANITLNSGGNLLFEAGIAGNTMGQFVDFAQCIRANGYYNSNVSVVKLTQFV